MRKPTEFSPTPDIDVRMGGLGASDCDFLLTACLDHNKTSFLRWKAFLLSSPKVDCSDRPRMLACQLYQWFNWLSTLKLHPTTLAFPFVLGFLSLQNANLLCTTEPHLYPLSGHKYSSLINPWQSASIA